MTAKDVHPIHIASGEFAFVYQVTTLMVIIVLVSTWYKSLLPQYIESFRLWDEDDYEYEIFSIMSIAHAWTSVIREIKERLRFTFTPNGKREFVSRDQVFPLFFVYCFIASTQK